MATATSTNRHDHLQPHLLGSRMHPFQQNATTGSYPSSKHVPFLASRTGWQLFFFRTCSIAGHAAWVAMVIGKFRRESHGAKGPGCIWSLGSQFDGLNLECENKNQHLLDFVVGKHTLNLTYLSYIYTLNDQTLEICRVCSETPCLDNIWPETPGLHFKPRVLPKSRVRPRRTVGMETLDQTWLGWSSRASRLNDVWWQDDVGWWSNFPMSNGFIYRCM